MTGTISVVLGSVMVDRVLYLPTLPRPGVTVIGDRLEVHLGGKGLNQAMQIHRLGGKVTFIGAIGKRDDGDWVLEMLQAFHFPYPGLRRLEKPTGNALICVDALGQNQIGVHPGANMAIKPAHVTDAMAGLPDGGYFLASMEVPEAAIEAGLRLAKDQERTTVVNAAPWREIPEAWWPLVDGWVLNTQEAEACFGPGRSPADSPEHPAVQHARWIIITRSERGAECYLKGEAPIHIPAPKVEAVDTVGAGDCFCGALLWKLGQGAPLAAALEFAVTAAAIACTVRGAVASLPTLTQIEGFLAGPS